MRSTSTTKGRRGPGAAWTLAFVALLVAATCVVVACGGSASSGDATASASAAADQSSSVSSDGFTAAWPKSAEVMKPVAPDALLVAAGTTGLSLSDVPDAWSFTYFSPAKGTVYSVDVAHGKAGRPQKLGTTKGGVKVKHPIDVAAINIGGGQAVIMARAFGEKKGTVPRNVVVGGVFAQLPGGSAAGYTPGVWIVVFATGTDLADAQTYTVDMTTGVVAKAKSK